MNWGEDVENDEPMDISIGNEHTLYTGGCDGVDVCAEDMARSMDPVIEEALSSLP